MSERKPKINLYIKIIVSNLTTLNQSLKIFFIFVVAMASSSYVGTFTLSPNPSLLFPQTKHSAASRVRVTFPIPSTTRRRRVVRAESMSTVTEKLGIKIERNPPESKLTQLGVRQWPK